VSPVHGDDELASCRLRNRGSGCNDLGAAAVMLALVFKALEDQAGHAHEILEISCSLEPDAEAVALVLPIQQYSDRRISRARVLAL